MNAYSRTTTNRIVTALLAVVVVAGAGFFVPEPAFALDAPSRGMSGSNLNEANQTEVQETEPSETQAVGDDQSAPPFLGGLLAPFTGLAYIIWGFANFLLWIAGALFNWMLVETVLEFGQNFGNSPGIIAAWKILRDISNIFLLFSFVFMGIATILNLHDYTVKKTLPRLIIFAVLLNFSLFASGAIIDVTNGLSATISAQTTAATECPPGMTVNECAKNVGVSGSIATASGIATSLAPPYDVWQTLDWNYQLGMIQTLLGLSIFTTVLTVVLFAAAILFVFRVVVLTLLMVASPIGFAGMAVPFLGGLAKKWWSMLINQAFFAPVYLLLVFIGLKIASSTPFSGGNLTEALRSGDVNTLQAIVMFAIISGFMIAALLIAKRFGAVGADFAIGTASNLTYGTLGFIGRRTIGRTALNAASRLRRSDFGKSEAGRRLALVLDKGANSSFDFRGGTIAKVMTGATGVSLGSAQGAAAKGIQGIIDQDDERKRHYDESIEEEDERAFKAEKNKHDVLKGDYENAGGDKARLAGSKSASAIYTQMRAQQAKMEQTHEGQKYFREKTLEDVNASIKQLTATLANTRQRLQSARDRSEAIDSSKDPAAKRLAEMEIKTLVNDITRQETFLGGQEKQVESLTEQIAELNDEIRKEKLIYSRSLSKSADWNRFIPGTIGDRSNRQASAEIHRLVDRSPEKAQFEKLIGAIKGVGAAGHGGGGGHGGDGEAPATVMVDTGHTAEGHH